MKSLEGIDVKETRSDQLLSLCGLNCGLCPQNIGDYCIGCTRGEDQPDCAFAVCNKKTDHIDYCFECSKYPCRLLIERTRCDSIITHQHQIRDLDKARHGGLEAYAEEQRQKQEILKQLLQGIEANQRVTIFQAVNLLEVPDLLPLLELSSGQQVISQIQEVAFQKNISLELRTPFPSY